MIVGTSTGGIIAALAGFMAYPLSQCQELYDSLVHKIFVKHPTGGMKLALTQASGQGVVVHCVPFLPGERKNRVFAVIMLSRFLTEEYLGAFCSVVAGTL